MPVLSKLVALSVATVCVFAAGSCEPAAAKGSKGGGGNVSAGWTVKQGATARTTTTTKGKGQQYIKYEMKDTNISR